MNEVVAVFVFHSKTLTQWTGSRNRQTQSLMSENYWQEDDRTDINPELLDNLMNRGLAWNDEP